MHLARLEGHAGTTIAATLLKSSSSTFNGIKPLVQLWPVLCISTVVCERGFSLMSAVKTKARNKLKTATLSNLMQIAANGPAFPDRRADPPSTVLAQLIEDALEHWKMAAKRNIRKSHPGVAGRKKKRRERAIRLNLLLLGINCLERTLSQTPSPTLTLTKSF